MTRGFFSWKYTSSITEGAEVFEDAENTEPHFELMVGTSSLRVLRDLRVLGDHGERTSQESAGTEVTSVFRPEFHP